MDMMIIWLEEILFNELWITKELCSQSSVYNSSVLLSAKKWDSFGILRVFCLFLFDEWLVEPKLEAILNLIQIQLMLCSVKSEMKELPCEIADIASSLNLDICWDYLYCCNTQTTSVVSVAFMHTVWCVAVTVTLYQPHTDSPHSVYR